MTVASIVRSPLGEKKVMISADGMVAPHSYPKLWYGLISYVIPSDRYLNGAVCSIRLAKEYPVELR